MIRPIEWILNKFEADHKQMMAALEKEDFEVSLGAVGNPSAVVSGITTIVIRFGPQSIDKAQAVFRRLLMTSDRVKDGMPGFGQLFHKAVVSYNSTGSLGLCEKTGSVAVRRAQGLNYEFFQKLATQHGAKISTKLQDARALFPPRAF